MAHIHHWISLSNINRILYCLLFILTACSDKSVDSLQEEGELVVLTRNAPTTWYEGREGTAGPEYDLASAFASHYGLKVRFEILQNIDDILEAINNNKAHLVAAGITRTDLRDDKGYIFGPDYQHVQQLVICRRGNGKIPATAVDLVGKRLAIIAASSYEESLQDLKENIPELTWYVINDADTEQLLQHVWEKKLDCTLSDSNIFSIHRRYYPELVVAFPVSEQEPLAWVLAPEWTGLYADIESWLKTMQDKGELASIHERYYGHIDNYDYVDISRFKRRMKQRLPKYRKRFVKVARKYKLPWTLLAAQAYQESHWDPKSISPTGVRGLMMLTLRTAKSLGINNRLDPAQSIEGGARYLYKMYQRIPEQVQEQDRLWYALAAYNVGFGHLQDARLLAEKLGKDPDRWVTLKEVLPLLSEKKHYRTLPHGYARGGEPVIYVQRIREYQQILEQQLLKSTGQLVYGF
jgi:membrane-bound lytic murein transglycosylase F